MDETIKSIIIQFPMVAIVLYIQYKETQAHQRAIDWHRAQIAMFTQWFLDHSIVIPSKPNGGEEKS